MCLHYSLWMMSYEYQNEVINLFIKCNLMQFNPNKWDDLKANVLKYVGVENPKAVSLIENHTQKYLKLKK